VINTINQERILKNKSPIPGVNQKVNKFTPKNAEAVIISILDGITID
jgi:hypothetical protein